MLIVQKNKQTGITTKCNLPMVVIIYKTIKTIKVHLGLHFQTDGVLTNHKTNIHEKAHRS